MLSRISIIVLILSYDLSAMIAEFASTRSSVILRNLSNDPTVSDSSSIRIQALMVLEGSQRYRLEESIDVLKYDYVVIHCTKWNHWYGSAKLKACKME